MKDLKARAQRAAASTKMVENILESKGLPVDQSAKRAIQAGAETVKEEAKEIINSSQSATVAVQSSETTNAANY